MVGAAPNPPNQSIADLVGSSRYNAIGDDSLKDEDNAAWVMFLPTEVARDWIEPFSWIRLIDRLAESEWIEGWGSRFQVFRIGWRTLLLTGYVLPDDYHVGLLSQMHARWFRAAGPASLPALPRPGSPQRASVPPVGPGPGPDERPPPRAGGLATRFSDALAVSRGPGQRDGVAVPRRPSPAPRLPAAASALTGTLTSSPPVFPPETPPAIPPSRPLASTSSRPDPTAEAGPAWSTVHAWDEYVEATARYTRSDMVFETIEEYEHMLLSLGGSLFQIFPYLTEPQRQAVRAFGAVDQFFNHLRDLPEDTAQNLCYFPADVLERFGVERQEVLDGSCFHNPGYVKMMKFWLGDFVPYLYSQAAPFLSDNEMHYSWRLLKHWFLRRHVRLEHSFRRAGMNYKLASQLYFAEVKPGLKRWLRETFAAEGRLDLLAAGPRPLPVVPVPVSSTRPSTLSPTRPPILPTSLPGMAALKPSAASYPGPTAAEYDDPGPTAAEYDDPLRGGRLLQAELGAAIGPGEDNSGIPIPLPIVELSDPALVTSAAPLSAIRTARRAPDPAGPPSRGPAGLGRLTSRPPLPPVPPASLLDLEKRGLGPPGHAVPPAPAAAFDDELPELAPEFAEARAYNSGILVLRRRDRGLGAR